MTNLDAFDYLAFVVMAVLLAMVVVIIVTVGSLPGKIAAGRNHPYAAAVRAAGWLSLITLGALWPLAFVWAFIPPRAAPSEGKGGSAR